MEELTLTRLLSIADACLSVLSGLPGDGDSAWGLRPAPLSLPEAWVLLAVSHLGPESKMLPGLRLCSSCPENPGEAGLCWPTALRPGLPLAVLLWRLLQVSLSEGSSPEMVRTQRQFHCPFCQTCPNPPQLWQLAPSRTRVLLIFLQSSSAHSTPVPRYSHQQS